MRNHLEKKMQRKTPSPATAANPAPAVSSLGEILTVQETASLLKVPPSSIYEWTRYRGSHRGTPLPHRKVGKYLRFLRSELMEWLLALPQSTHPRKRKYTRKNQVAVSKTGSCAGVCCPCPIPATLQDKWAGVPNRRGRTTDDLHSDRDKETPH
jgi:excisionase family DNA binding protein